MRVFLLVLGIFLIAAGLLEGLGHRTDWYIHVLLGTTLFLTSCSMGHSQKKEGEL